ncbi:hypothetical protein AAFF_G00225180 [Aldrovandia affinis]|uniref:Uncharacterized protein n=1 Tax=Aldrovandia affinis TaxID=143900 RepID=A0AAD7X2A3_9TELE|nr:hypothetical protein AAFF_G00225180 [Aldrovandia affinis]
MKTRTFMCTCTIAFIFLVVQSHSTPKKKLNLNNWGPQSMMYLKGKYGRRLAPDYDGEGIYKLGLNNWYTVFKGFQRLKPVVVRKARRMLKAENVVIGYLE